MWVAVDSASAAGVLSVAVKGGAPVPARLRDSRSALRDETIFVTQPAAASKLSLRAMRQMRS